MAPQSRAPWLPARGGATTVAIVLIGSTQRPGPGEVSRVETQSDRAVAPVRPDPALLPALSDRGGQHPGRNHHDPIVCRRRSSPSARDARAPESLQGPRKSRRSSRPADPILSRNVPQFSLSRRTADTSCPLQRQGIGVHDPLGHRLVERLVDQTHRRCRATQRLRSSRIGA